ncbi:MAG: murein L,D-transpeptidase catalytic domain family protein [Flavobacteriales bacterium]|nr:murein L,D-transpeptidase catalytic domain family protein [Flavobacteriales bacterium]
MKKWSIIVVVILGWSCHSKAEVKTQVRLKEKAVEAKAYCEQNNLNTSVCILVDMTIHSGKERFFLWDLEGDSVIKSGVCSHGACDNLSNYDPDKKPQFSNTPDTHCSSLGKYKVGKRGYSTFGVHINYKLHGLEKTNNNAYKRYIVFHSWSIIDDEEVYPFHIAESWGCPAVSDNMMLAMDKVLKEQEKPVLFWIYN